MEFFKKLFGGGNTADRAGLYFYVKPHTCTEIIRVRIDSNNDLSLADDNSTYFVRKTVRGTTYKCNRSAELELTFGADRRLQNTECMGGLLVSKEEYDAWVASQQEPAT